MNVEEFAAEAKITLKDVLDRTGSILYSAGKTLAPGNIYILGLNPGGTGGGTIRENLDALPNRTANAYIDEDWSEDKRKYAIGKAPFQVRVGWLTEALGYPLRDVCASNLIFMKSPRGSGIRYPDDAKTCWPVHELILDIVRPKLILAVGNGEDRSAYAYLRGKFKGKEGRIPAGHGAWQCKGFMAQIAGGNVFIAGLPHLSYYSPNEKIDVVKWLKEGSDH